jgi:small subunit ribosomal protein S9
LGIGIYLKFDIMAKKVNYTYATGRRKSSRARVRIFRGKGETTVNGKPIDVYFPGPINKKLWQRPFGITETSDKYFATVRVVGGGLHGQLEAVAHGLSRALAKAKPDAFKSLIKKAGLLTRDARTRQRRMVGMGGKSRRQKQSPKR